MTIFKNKINIKFFLYFYLINFYFNILILCKFLQKYKYIKKIFGNFWILDKKRVKLQGF